MYCRLIPINQPASHLDFITSGRDFFFFFFFFFLMRLGMPQAILLIMATSQIPRRAFAGIRTHDPLVESPTS
jgi:hypothetical protein